MLLKFVPWLIFLHVLSAFTFFLAHGASVAMAFKIRSESNFDRIRAMLDLSGSTIGVMFVAFLVMGITGLILPFMLKLWGKGWVWASIVLMVIVLIQMGLMNDKRYKQLRRMVGLPYMIRGDHFDAEPPASQEEVEAYIRKIKITDLVIVGYVIPIIVLWLMMFKPF